MCAAAARSLWREMEELVLHVRRFSGEKKGVWIEREGGGSARTRVWELRWVEECGRCPVRNSFHWRPYHGLLHKHSCIRQLFFACVDILEWPVKKCFLFLIFCLKFLFASHLDGKAGLLCFRIIVALRPCLEAWGPNLKFYQLICFSTCSPPIVLIHSSPRRAFWHNSGQQGWLGLSPSIGWASKSDLCAVRKWCKGRDRNKKEMAFLVLCFLPCLQKKFPSGCRLCGLLILLLLERPCQCEVCLIYSGVSWCDSFAASLFCHLASMPGAFLVSFFTQHYGSLKKA